MRNLFGTIGVTVFTVCAFAVIADADESAGEPTLTRVVVGDSRCRIEWEPAVGEDRYNVYLKLPDGQYQLLNPAPIKDDHVRIADLINGKPYRFAVTRVLPDGSESAAAKSGLVIPLGYSHKVINVKGGSKASDYRLISTPYAGRKGPDEVFAYFPKYDINMWRIFSVERDGFKEFMDIPSIEPGKGYWFLSRDESEIFLSGKTTNAYEPFAVRLHPGWNIIGSPFLFPVSWKEVLIHNLDRAGEVGNAIWEFENGGYRKTASLEPFKGYYLYNGLGGDVEILIPPVPDTAGSSVDDSRSASLQAGMFNAESGTAFLNPESPGWAISISADDGTYNDTDNIIGYSPDASNGSENFTQSAEPPAWPQHLSFYFTKEGEKDMRRSLDIRSRQGDWLAFVEGGEAKIVTLRWETIKGNPDSLLIDLETGEEIKMGEGGSYRFAREKQSPRKFIIRAFENEMLSINR
jgi:hypothetical protein